MYIIFSYRYGVNEEFLRATNNYWLHNYNWQKWQDVLNSFPHFKTQLSGLDIHFLHAKSKRLTTKRTILLLHGWPGSVFEFYKLIPMLTNDENQPFDVVAPSIPGFAWSEGASKKGEPIIMYFSDLKNRI